MKTFFILFISIFSISSLYAKNYELDTIYYDKDWKGVSTPHFADFYRIIEKHPDPNLQKKFRDYYITGELQGSGYYISIDPTDDHKSIMDGECTSYYKNGQIAWIQNFSQGKLNGEVIVYNEDGSIKQNAHFFNGLQHGAYTEYNDNGLCIQDEYSMGKPIYDYYVVSNKDGLYSKFNRFNNSPIYTSPEESDVKKSNRDGQTILYYMQDGLFISTTCTEVSDYGKYYRIFFNITNNSFSPITISPQNIKAGIIDKKNNHTLLEVQTAEEYQKRIRRTQRWEEGLTAFANGLAASSAGYSTRTTNFYYNGIYGSATTRTYDANAAYASQLAANQRIASMSESNYKIRQSRNEGYIKTTTIDPGESVSGYFNIKKKKGKLLKYRLTIETAKFNFTWNIDN